MAEPVAKNARKAILVVLLEVVVLNLVMAYAMSALPSLRDVDAVPTASGDYELVHENGEKLSVEARNDVRDHAVKILASHYVAPWFVPGPVCADTGQATEQGSIHRPATGMSH